MRHRSPDERHAGLLRRVAAWGASIRSRSDEFRPCRDLTVDVRLYLGLVTSGAEALVALHVAKQSGVVSAPARATNARTGGGVEGVVFAVERCVCRLALLPDFSTKAATS